MDLLIEKLIELLTFKPETFLQTILLLLIWLNVRSLKKILTTLQENHELRITKLEIKTGIRENLSSI